jgi:hypothetical protein
MADRARSDDHNATELEHDLRSFSCNGRRTHVERRHGAQFFINEFWTKRQRQAHSIQEVSYRACFKPQLPEFFIKRLSTPGDTVYDPFMGRGTTPIQAALMARRPIGNDTNPLSIYLTRPRTAPPSLAEVSNRLAQIDWQGAQEQTEQLLVFYHPDTLTEITSLREYLLLRESTGSLDPVDDWIRMVALNRLTGHSPGFFSAYSLPPNQAVSLAAQAKINRKRNQTPPRRDVPAIILKKTRELLRDGTVPRHPAGLFLTRSAESTPEIASRSVQLVVTSPPFLDVVQYASDNWLRCWFAGLDASSLNIAMHRNAKDWTSFIARVFRELERVLAPGGHVAFEVGEVRGGEIELEELVLRAVRGPALDVLGVMVNDQTFTKTAHCWGVSNNRMGTNTNRIVVAQRN